MAFSRRVGDANANGGSSMQTLREVYDRLALRRVDLSSGFLYQLHAALQWMPDAPVERLTADDVCRMMRTVLDSGRSAKTARNYRQSVLYMLASVGNRIDPRDCRPPKLIRKRPTAWTPEELRRLVGACRMMRWERGWGPRHWEALTIAAYETAARIGALLLSDVSHMDERHCTLFIPGEHQKSNGDTLHPLHAETVQLLAGLPRPDRRLFPWPYNRRVIWTRYGEILRRAGLPDTSRDKFHRLRRTSYTFVAVALGKEAATIHAAHKSDLSAHYLDTTFLPKPNPLDALPRPA